MELDAIHVNDVAVVESRPGEPLLATAEDVARVIEACFANGAEAALLYTENLPGDFFDLSSGQAGAVLQKLRNYRLRLAVVCPDGSVPITGWFRAMLDEESRGNDFRLFETREAALEWLSQAGTSLAE